MFSSAVPSSLTIPQTAIDSYETWEDTSLNVGAPGVLKNDVSPLGNSLTATLPSTPTQGTVSVDASGSFIFTPTPNFSGNATFTYKANDGTNNSNPATVTINVIAVNDAPVLTDSSPEDTIYYHSTQTPVIVLPGISVQDADTSST